MDGEDDKLVEACAAGDVAAVLAALSAGASVDGKHSGAGGNWMMVRLASHPHAASAPPPGARCAGRGARRASRPHAAVGTAPGPSLSPHVLTRAAPQSGRSAVLAAVGQPACLRLLVERGASAKEWVNEEGQTLLHLAVQAGTEDGVRYLLQELRVNPSAASSGRWNEGETPLHLALPRASYPAMPAIINLLLEAGADPNAPAGVRAPRCCGWRVLFD